MNRRGFLAGAAALVLLGKLPASEALDTPLPVPVLVEEGTAELTTLSTINGILKEYYIGPVVAQLNNDVLLLSRLDKSDSLTGTYSLAQGYKPTI